MARYAAKLWADHAVLALEFENIAEMTVRFLEKEFQQWTRLYQPDRSWDKCPGPPRGSKLYFACFIGLAAPARDLISKGADINAQGGRYDNALQTASSEGHRDIVKLLQQRGTITSSSKRSGSTTSGNPVKSLHLMESESSGS